MVSLSPPDSPFKHLAAEASVLLRRIMARPQAAAAGAAGALACLMLAAVVGVVLGRTPPVRSGVAAGASHVRHVALVVAAREQIVEPPPMAPEKLVDGRAAGASHVAPRASRRSGFGHMGSDRALSTARASEPVKRRAASRTH